MTVALTSFSFSGSAYRCGHCGVTTATQSIGQVAEDWDVVLCASCGRPSLQHSPLGKPNRLYPHEGWPRVRNLDKVPELIGNDYVEAVECFIASNYKAAATMARRTVQGVCLELGADVKKRLVDQIDDLMTQGILTKRLTALAHDVRVLGNDGAHPRDDGLDEIEEDGAQQGIEFVEHLLQHVYII